MFKITVDKKQSDTRSKEETAQSLNHRMVLVILVILILNPYMKYIAEEFLLLF